MGKRLPIDAASAIAGFYISLDLLKNIDELKGFLISSLICKWVTDQLIDNAVSVYFGQESLEFIKLADDTYSSPPGMTSECPL